ncbi:MAG: hypothetical protein Kilf2KO_47770 [Rhodospirillales bacterium]
MPETDLAPPPDQPEERADAAPEAPEESAPETEAPSGETEAAGFSFPEGFAVDEAQLSGFQDWVAANAVEPSQAQALIDLYLQGQEKQRQEALDARVAEVGDWEARARSDAVTGGPDFERKLAVARGALDRFGDPGLRDLLDASGLGSHPDVLRWMYRVGQATADDRFIPPGSGSAPLSPEARARRLYDNTYKD